LNDLRLKNLTFEIEFDSALERLDLHAGGFLPLRRTCSLVKVLAIFPVVAGYGLEVVGAPAPLGLGG